MEMQHKFVEFMPDNIEEGIVYISLEYGSVIHLCACGCREEVNTPLSPTGWELTYDGKYLSLSPSIGNWNFDCRSHYWIKKNKVVWAENWSDEQVQLKRKYDKEELDTYYENNMPENNANKKPNNDRMRMGEKIRISKWEKLLKLFGFK